MQPAAFLREHTVVLRDAARRCLAILEEFGQMAHRRQWRPELMRNRCDEIRLQASDAELSIHCGDDEVARRGNDEHHKPQDCGEQISA